MSLHKDLLDGQIELLQSRLKQSQDSDLDDKLMKMIEDLSRHRKELYEDPPPRPISAEDLDALLRSVVDEPDK